MNNYMYDVVIIGAGVSGAAIARELSRYDLKIAVVEKTEDLCSGTSKANSGLVHGGHDAKPGTLKAKLNVEGNQLIEQLSKDLDFNFKRNGALVCCFDKSQKTGIQELYERGIKNKVPHMQIVSGDKARAMQPELSDDIVQALHIPTSGLVDPFNLTVALGENACDNGVDFIFNTEVTNITTEKKVWCLQTKTTPYVPVSPKSTKPPTHNKMYATYIVNAAGVYADVIHNMVSKNKIKIIARKGDYCLFDKTVGNVVSMTIFQLPTAMGKGTLVTPTVHGNLLIGPTATDIEDKEQTATTASDIEKLLAASSKSLKHIPYRHVITSFTGVRAHQKKDDFMIEECADAPGFFDVAGIESPGLSCAPALGVYVANMLVKKAGARKKEHFIATRKGIPELAKLSFAERAKLIKERPEYGTIVCRCEGISEGEIIDACKRTLGATSLDGVKRRVRAGMGRCQAGFCTPRHIEIIARECGIAKEEVCKNVAGSPLLLKKTNKELFNE
ncbi:MAG TPA: NAD(P)/FAD-dependent oxidoreductase [Treponemataceae bacterium]|nr:NAD(P)/FAD-dependent oxidoreductase [Treponemataceae bacterium]